MTVRLKDGTVVIYDESITKKYIHRRCPKCSAKLSIYSTKEACASMWYPDCYHYYWYVICTNCNTESSPLFCDDDADWNDTVNEILDKYWK